MANSQHKVMKVLEIHQISPPLGSVPKTSLPLTFFDIPWLLFSPSQPLFFYEFSHSTHHFITAILPNLTHSLSLNLQHFFPLAGKLSASPPPTKPHLTYADGDSVALTVAESAADFLHLSGHHHRDVHEFHQLVPGLSSSLSSDPHEHPLMAVQITVFPQCGICVGFTFRHVAADGRTFDNFLQSWASINRMGPQVNKLLLPLWDRSMIKDPNGLEPILLNEWWKLKSQHKVVMDTNGVVCEDMVRATFVVGQPEMEKIKQWILTRSKVLFRSCPLLLSPYVLTCALLWVSLIKAREIMIENESESDEFHYFGFIAGGITRLDFPVPATYLGNCVGFGRSVLTRSHLRGEDGVVFAAKSIGDTIKKLNGEVLGDGERWILDWEELIGSDIHVMVTGSPKVNLYGLDFGWGRPKKIEEISIDKTRAVYLADSRDVKGGIEVGLALHRAKMDCFGSLFTEGLNGLF